MSPDQGSCVHSEGVASTVSTCESRHSVGPSPVPRRRATRFGRSGVRPSSSTSSPAPSSTPARCSCATRSSPGGLTVLKRISSWRRPTASAMGSGYAKSGGYSQCMAGQLFEPEEPHAEGPGADAPLPARMRPRTLDEVVGQEHVLGEGTTLRAAIEEGRPFSMVLYGPPGTGKTTIARLVAAAADAAFEELSAVQVGKAEVRGVLDRARERRRGGRGTIFFLDEIHRFNKAQQDALLPAVEEGLVTLIGATTENPYFEVNSALISRTQIIELRALTDADVEVLLRRAMDRGELGEVDVDDEALAFLAARAGGDARTALSALELAAETTPHVTLEVAEDALQRRAIRYDRAGDQHYDTISAWIKATRGS